MISPDRRFEEVIDDLRLLGAEAGVMFGRRAMKADGSVFAVLQDGALAFRLGAETREFARAMQLDGSVLFDPSRKGRPFADWVSVQASESEHWAIFAEVALRRLRQKL